MRRSSSGAGLRADATINRPPQGVELVPHRFAQIRTSCRIQGFALDTRSHPTALLYRWKRPSVPASEFSFGSKPQERSEAEWRGYSAPFSLSPLSEAIGVKVPRLLLHRVRSKRLKPAPVLGVALH